MVKWVIDKIVSGFPCILIIIVWFWFCWEIERYIAGNILGGVTCYYVGR